MEFPLCSKFCFSKWKIDFFLFIFIEKYFVTSLIFCKFSLIFNSETQIRTWFFKLSLDSKLEFLCLGLRLYFNLFSYSLKYWKLGFNFALVGLHNFSSLWKWWNNGIFQCLLRLYFQISPNSLKSWKIDIFEFHLVSYLVRL